jgi:predicted nucleic acid-binding protein
VANEYFIDTNILLYVLQPKDVRHPKACELVQNGATMSVQVLNEFVNVCQKKFGFTYLEAAKALIAPKIDCKVAPLNLETHELALSIVLKHKIHIYDANIVAAAELAGCDVLYTEDLSDGQRIGRVTIRNPFV